MEMLVTTGDVRHAMLKLICHQQQTNIQFFYRPDALPVADLTVSKHWREIGLDALFCQIQRGSSPNWLPSEGTFGTAVIGLVYNVSVAMHLYLSAAGCSEVCINIQCDIYPEAQL